MLLEMASERFGVPVEALSVSEGVISVRDDPARSVTYGELIGGRRFDVALTGGNINAATGVASIKPVQDLKLVGQSIPRYDIPGKVDASLEWAVDVTLPGMVHARNVRPPLAGATLAAIDESSVRDLPGFIRVVSEGNYVAVVCEREEQAIEAAERLVVEWEKPATAPFPASDDLFDYMRSAERVPGSGGRSAAAQAQGDPDGALARAATVVEAAYDIPFHGHTAIGPAHALADPSDGQMTIYTNDMKPYSHRTGIAEFLGMDPEQVRVIWMDGPQLYGRTAADDAGFEAAYLARELGRPVRVQWMRHEETAWDTKGPAFAIDLRGGLDADGNVVALDYRGRIANYAHVGIQPGPDGADRAVDGLPAGAAVSGRRARARTRCTTSRTGARRRGRSASRWPSRRRSAPATCATPTARRRPSPGSRSSTSWPRPRVPIRWSSGCACCAGRADDDEAFRRARSIAVVEAAAEAYGWDARPSPGTVGSGRVLTGRGIAYAYRARTTIAVIAEVEVDRETGRVWVRRMVCAHDCGLVINPNSLESTIQGNLLHGISRTLYEEVRFDGEKVTSVDWRTHPTLTHMDTPERIDVVMVNGDPNPDRPDLRPYGAGEPSHRPVPAAIANAIYDATGVRMRRLPLRPERVLGELG